MRQQLMLFLCLLNVFLFFSFSMPVQAAVTVTVTTTADTIAADGDCSLREAITAANTNATVNECVHDGSPGIDTIRFDIGAAGSTQTVTLGSGLPAINDAVILDGTTQSGAAGCDQITNPLIVLNGAGTFNGLTIDNGGSGSTVRGLVLQNFNNSGMRFAGTTGSALQCSYVGTNVTGTGAAANTNFGVQLFSNATSNIIGTDGDGVNDDVEGNLISGNGEYGVYLVNSQNNVIAGNRIGTNAAGDAAIPNVLDGIWMQNGSTGTRIGTDGDGTSDDLEGNLISGNGDSGILIIGVGETNNVIAGNIIGLDAAGTAILSNGEHGVAIVNGAFNNRIGSNSDGVSDALERNIISGNLDNGVFLQNGSNNQIAGNYIGTDITGTVDLGNTLDGVQLLGATTGNNVVGTDGDGNGDAREGNLISGNERDGVRITGGAFSNRISGNLIGTDVNGTLALGNDDNGVRISNGSNNVIGTDGDGVSNALERNIISGQRLQGVLLVQNNTTNNRVAGNLIGTDVNGTAAIANRAHGISVQQGANNNVIGTDGDGSAGDAVEGNLISGNDFYGVQVAADSNSNRISGNFIGTDITGTVALGNGTIGIIVNNGPDDTIVGSNGDGISDALEGNLVSGNGGRGIYIIGTGTANTTIAANTVGLVLSQSAALGNSSGIYISDVAGVTIGGANDALGNTVGGNSSEGILVRAGTTGPIIISHNFVGTNASFNNLANGTHGIDLNLNNAVPVQVDYNRVFNHSQIGLRVRNNSDLGANGVSVGNCIVNNATGVDNRTGVQVIFENNSYGSADGPSGAGSGTGDSVSTDVDFDPFISTEVDRCAPLPPPLTPPLTPPTGMPDAALPAIAVFDPAISKLGLLVPGQVGVTDEQLEWVVTVRNVGGVGGQNVTITDRIDDRMQINRVEAPGAAVNISGQTVNVAYPTLAVGETVTFSIFTTVVDGESVSNTACVMADNQAGEECATGSSVFQLPDTGEAPPWRIGS